MHARRLLYCARIYGLYPRAPEINWRVEAKSEARQFLLDAFMIAEMDVSINQRIGPVEEVEGCACKCIRF